MLNTIQSREYSRGGGRDEIFRNTDGEPNVLNANCNDDGRWFSAGWSDPDRKWDAYGVFVFLVPAALFISLYTFCKESFSLKVVRSIFPPSILPISFNFSESKLYCLLFKDFVFQRIIKNIFKVSVFDRTFIAKSYSCKLNKGTHKVIKKVQEFSNIASKNNTKTCWVLKCDIKKFFTNIDHEILLKILN